MDSLTTEFIADTFDMKGYRTGSKKRGIETISVKQIVSKIPLHVAVMQGRQMFKVAPDPIMGTIATAIGLEDILISTVKSEQNEG